jgi:TPR repeat protein
MLAMQLRMSAFSHASLQTCSTDFVLSYLQGQGVPQDFAKALALFRKAANQGLANAQSNLGVMYAVGYGVAQDYKEAIDWFRKAANQGYQIAMPSIATLNRLTTKTGIRTRIVGSISSISIKTSVL